MWVADQWKDYKLLDASDGEKLEDWKGHILIRPDPQAIWKTPRRHPAWQKAGAHYIRSRAGGGHWEVEDLPERWTVAYKNLTFQVRPMNFKHTGLFPEQAINWDFMADRIQNAGRPLKVLNLFAYTGGATMACAKAGAHVVHVDAAKGMVAWAKENAALCGLADHPIRYIVDDCAKFVAREIRRGNRYDGIVMDPPSYGRGPGGEVWKLEEKLYDLITLCEQVLSDDPVFFLVNSYSTGLSASVMGYMLRATVGEKFGGDVTADEIGLKIEGRELYFPAGATARWSSR